MSRIIMTYVKSSILFVALFAILTSANPYHKFSYETKKICFSIFSAMQDTTIILLKHTMQNKSKASDDMCCSAYTNMVDKIVLDSIYQPNDIAILSCCITYTSNQFPANKIDTVVFKVEVEGLGIHIPIFIHLPAKIHIESDTMISATFVYKSINSIEFNPEEGKTLINRSNLSNIYISDSATFRGNCSGLPRIDLQDFPQVHMKEVDGFINYTTE